MLTTILAFILTLGVLIVIHEYGHYSVARACGVKVLRFSIGFGRVLWRRQPTPGGTEFTICALPFGGYVQMLGQGGGPVAEADRHQAFDHKPLWQRAAIVAAGPAANLLLAVVLYAAVNWTGVQEPKAVLGAPIAAGAADRAGMRSGDWVRQVSADSGASWQAVRSLSDLRWQVTQAVLRSENLDLLVTRPDGSGQRKLTLPLAGIDAREIDARLLQKIGLGDPWSDPVLGKVEPTGAGARAGLQPKDRVISIDGRAIGDSSQVRSLIRASAQSGTAQPMQWVVERNGGRIDLPVTANVVFDNGGRVGRLDVIAGQPPEVVTVRYGAIDGLIAGAQKTWEMSALTVKMLGRMLIGEASLKNLSGPVTIADYAGQSVRLGLAYFLGFLAIVSVSLGVLNLLPLPVLDGGHLMYYLFEAVTGRPVSELWLDRLQRGGVAVMLMMMSLALYNDVTRVMGLP